MNDLRKGTIIIGEKKENGLLKKHTVYGGSLKASPGVYGYSTNKTFAKEYHRDDEVKAEYEVYMGGRKDDYDEVMKFRIIEE